MAEKGFGVKEINLIGASGTPTIESPNNLNLNAVNVAISTNVSIGGTLSVTGNVSVGGTLTYEDVTNIDSVGLITARDGIFIPDSKKLHIGNTAGFGDLQLYHDGNNSFIHDTGTGGIYIPASEFTVTNTGITQSGIKFIEGGSVELYEAGSKKIETTATGATVTGTLAATAVTGDGSGLTGIAVTEAPVVDYTITANGASAYRFHGGGVDETADNPNLFLIRGQKYRFNNTTGSGHPFAIREANGGSAYTNGVTGNNQGVQFFTVPYNAPAKIFYQCTIHSGMVGNIYIRGANGLNDHVGITTFSGTVHANEIGDAKGIRIHSNGGISATNNELRFNTGQSSGFTFMTNSDGGSSNERIRIDSNGISGDVKNNFLLNEFKRTDTSAQHGPLSTSFTTDTTINLTISNYQRGQRIIIRACVPCGMALGNSSGTNYGGTDVRVKVTGGTSGAATYSNNRASWYRADGAGTHETTQNVFICVYINESDTTFSNGETLTITLEGRKNSGSAGTTTHYLGGWSTSKELTSERYIKEL